MHIYCHIGQQLRHISEEQESIDLLEEDSSLIFNQTIADITRLELNTYDIFAGRSDFAQLLTEILMTINRQSGAQDLWIARCPLVSACACIYCTTVKYIMC